MFLFFFSFSLRPLQRVKNGCQLSIHIHISGEGKHLARIRNLSPLIYSAGMTFFYDQLSFYSEHFIIIAGAHICRVGVLDPDIQLFAA